jgi:branched-chain amino acid aminotransferase
VDRTELYLADEVFICGTAAEITPITSVDRYQVAAGEIGPVTRELERVFSNALRGNEDRFTTWRTPVGVPQVVRA